MLRRISEPLALSEASLLALRPALNAPVLNVDYLPVGPARAAIVIFAEEYGGIGMAFGVRSTEGGQVAVFRNREPIDESAPLEEILEPALAAAERIGFLFDEDMVEGTPGGQGRAEATALWGRLMGDLAMPPSPKAAPPLPAATEPILDLTETMIAAEEVPELVLDEVALAEAVGPSEPVPAPLKEIEVEQSTQPPAPVAGAQVPLAQAAETEPELEHAAPIAESAPDKVEPPAPVLSKFRHPPPSAAMSAPADSMTTSRDSAGETDGGSALGRVSLVRVRRDGDTPKRIPYLARLLSSF